MPISAPKRKPAVAPPALVDAPKPGLVVDHLRSLIAAQGLSPGDRLPAERELARQLSVTRGDVRRGLGYLAALGALEVRHGVGAFLASSSPALGTAPLEFLRLLGGFETWQMFEARRVLETELVALAAGRSAEPHSATLAEELAEMFASVHDPNQFLIHDVRFHRAIAQASGNPILAAIMEVIAGALFEERQRVAGTLRNRTQALQAHRTIYHAIRTGNAEAARHAMADHLRTAETRSQIRSRTRTKPRSQTRSKVPSQPRSKRR